MTGANHIARRITSPASTCAREIVRAEKKSRIVSPMISSGLCSVTFRRLSAFEILKLTVQAGISAIEWGADLHVPPGNLTVARDVQKACADAGISTPSYGSYFRFETSPAESEFGAILETAQTLGATTIRVWAGRCPSTDLPSAPREKLVHEARGAASLTAAAGCVLGFEYHLGTATDGNEAARRFIEEVDHPAAKLYWQPRESTTIAERRQGLCEILPHLAHLHIFHWLGHPPVRHPLAEAESEWPDYLACAREATGDRVAFLEFVAGDDPSAFLRDAATLKRWLAE
jgi:3-dehydroshikimate dehydratase